MKSLRMGIVLGCLALSSVLFAQGSLSPEAQLKAAIIRETVDRDFAGAIEMYMQIADKFSGNHPVASKALLQMGGLYERMGRPEARATYQRIVSDYADTGTTAAAARVRLTALQEAAAGPFKVKSLDAWLTGVVNITGSPDGRYLSYWRTIDQRHKLFTREISSGSERLLADCGTSAPFGAFQWAPDSQRGAFATFGDVVEQKIATVATREIRSIGTSTARLGSYFKWSPDSRRLAVVKHVDKGPFELHIFTVGTPDDISVGPTLAPDGVPGFPGVVWSPDSRRIVYVVGGTEADTLRVQTLGAESTQAVVVSKPMPTSRITLSSWLPGGDIAFVQTVAGGNDYYLVSPSVGTPRKICEGRGSSGGDGCQDLSPDGTLQITRKNLTGGGRIVLRNVKDGSERSLTPEAVIEQTALGFSPDSRLFGFRSNREGSFGFYVVPTDAIPVAAPIKIFSFESDAANVSGNWTPGGMILRITNNQTNQYRVNIDPRTGRPTGSPIRLTQDSPTNIRARISPDGQQIAYVSRGRPTGIALMDANGGRERVIKEVPPDMLARMNILGWLSDSELLLEDAKLGTGSLRDAPKHLMRMNVATGDVREAGPVVGGGGVALASDGNVLYVVGSDDLFLRPIVGGPERAVKADGWWDYSVAGPWLAYSTVDESGGKGKPTPGDIRVRSIETGIERIAVKFADTDAGSQVPLDLSRDGRFLLYQEPLGKVMMANVATGESWPVLKNPPGGIDFESADARLSPDGSYLILDGYISKTTWRAYEGVTHDAVTKLIGPKK